MRAYRTPKPVLPSIVKRKRKEENPLPDPFPFPKNYRPDVEVALHTGNMSRETKAAFLSSIAGAMFSYKMYPVGEEYTRIACQIIRQYPFLKPPNGSPTVCFINVSFLHYIYLCYSLPSNSRWSIVSRNFAVYLRKEHQAVQIPEALSLKSERPLD